MVCSKKTLFSQSVSSASIRIVSRGMILTRLNRRACEGSSSLFPLSLEACRGCRTGRHTSAASEWMPRGALRVFRNAGGDFFQNFERNLLRLAVVQQIVLKLAIHFEGVDRVERRAQDHVAQANRVRQNCIFFQFIKRRFGVIVIHRSSRSNTECCENNYSTAKAA